MTENFTVRSTARPDASVDKYCSGVEDRLNAEATVGLSGRVGVDGDSAWASAVPVQLSHRKCTGLFSSALSSWVNSVSSSILEAQEGAKGNFLMIFPKVQPEG